MFFFQSCPTISTTTWFLCFPPNLTRRKAEKPWCVTVSRSHISKLFAATSPRSTAPLNANSVPVLLPHSYDNLLHKVGLFCCSFFVISELLILHCSMSNCVCWTLAVDLLRMESTSSTSVGWAALDTATGRSFIRGHSRPRHNEWTSYDRSLVFYRRGATVARETSAKVCAMHYRAKKCRIQNSTLDQYRINTLDHCLTTGSMHSITADHKTFFLIFYLKQYFAGICIF